MRNWPKTLRPASFRGVPFFVEKESLKEYGRRVAVLEYVKSEAYDTEDMGRRAMKVSVTAYVASDTAERDQINLINACTRPGAARLSLPFLGVFNARCTNVSTSAEKSKLGYIAFEIEFVREKRAEGASSASPAIGTRIAGGLLGSLASVGGAIGVALGPVSALIAAPLGIVSQAINVAGTVLGAAFSVIAAVQPYARLALGVAAMVRSVTTVKPRLLAIIPDNSSRARAAAAFEAVPRLLAAGEPIALAAMSMIEGIRTAAVSADPADMATTARELISAEGVAEPPASASIGRQREEAYAVAVRTLVRAILTVEMAIAETNAGRAPEPLSEELRAEVARDLGMDVLGIIEQAMAAVIEEAEAVVSAAAARSRLQAGRSFPSTALAWRLYGNPERGAEIADMNNSGTAFVLPADLIVATPEAEASIDVGY